jgi:class 3 adenylate cyclase
MQPKERTLAVVFADISGSTALYESLGDREAHRVIDRVLGVLRSTALEFRGRIVKSIGDEILCVFDDADGAVCAAGQMQERLAASRTADPAVPGIRVGIAEGPVLEDRGDVFGDTVNLASRVADVAQSGQVLTTRHTVDALAPAIRSTCRMLHPLEFKGIVGDVAIFEVIWNVEATLTMVVDGGPIGLIDPGRSLVLAHRGREIRINAEHRVARIGRDPANDLVVPARTASRMHARVQLRDSQFVLVDASVNGTFVRFDGKPEICLRRGETMLIGHGVIGLGESTTAEGAETVAFAQQ